LVAALPVYEVIHTNVKKTDYEVKHKDKSIRRQSKFPSIIESLSKQGSIKQAEYTPKTAYDRANLFNNIRQFTLDNHDLNELKQNIKICRYKSGKNKSVLVQKHVFASNDIENILEKIDKINELSNDRNKVSLDYIKASLTSSKLALRYNNFKKGNYDLYNSKLDILVG